MSELWFSLVPDRAERTQPLALVVPVYVLAIAAAEACVAFVGVVPGVLAHAILIAVGLNHYLVAMTQANRGPRDAATTGDSPNVLLALLLVPLLRVLSTALTLDVPEIYRYALVGVPLLFAAASFARFSGASPLRELLTRWSWREQAPIALSGLPLSLAAFLIVRPEPVADPLVWSDLLVGSAILIVFTGFAEEIVFRGVIQHELVAVLGRRGLLVSSFLFASVYLGVRPAVYVVFVALLGLVFAWVVDRTRSLAGISLAHGFLNAGAILVWPALLG